MCRAGVDGGGSAPRGRGAGAGARGAARPHAPRGDAGHHARLPGAPSKSSLMREVPWGTWRRVFIMKQTKGTIIPLGTSLLAQLTNVEESKFSSSSH